MKVQQQTFIASWIDFNSNSTPQVLEFERFSCKRVSTVKKRVEYLIKNYPKFYRKGNQVVIYATPDGYHEERLALIIRVSDVK